jgi:thioredoxin 1
MAVTPVTDADFVEVVLQSDRPVVVDFWAEWCGPCRMVAPVLDELSREHGEKVRFVKLNVDENPTTAAHYRITSIPTLTVFSGGSPVKQVIGAKPKAALVKELDAFLG